LGDERFVVRHDECRSITMLSFGGNDICHCKRPL
jgi:hypothetical protein